MAIVNGQSEITAEEESSSPLFFLRKSQQIHKVSAQLRSKKHHIQNIYDPVIVSIGPYHHHGQKPSLQQAERLKLVCLKWLSHGSDEKERLFYDKIMEKIDDVRSIYAESSILDKYSDEALALITLRDASFVLNYMANMTEMEGNNIADWRGYFGPVVVPFMVGDTLKLENQVPFKVLKLLISLQEGEPWKELVHSFLRWLLLRDGSKKRVKIPRENEDPPLHLLEVVWRAMAEKEEEEEPISQSSRLFLLQKMLSRLASVVGRKKKKKKEEEDDVLIRHNNHSEFMYQSAMDLRAKGIYFRPSSSTSYKSIKFKSFSYYGELQLPIRFMSDQHFVILSNLIAYELSPDAKTDYTVLSYTVFIKSLIAGPDDVKELQKRGILFNKYLDHEQVVRSYQEMGTYGLSQADVFKEVKMKIGDHCKNRPRAWTSDLIHSRFHSPWAIVRFLGAISVVCLTALQTFYAIARSR